MLDFLMISTRSTKRGVIEVYPRFRIYPKSTDLMIRGGDFYAVWVEERGLWSTDENDVLQLIDKELTRYVEEHRQSFDGDIKVLYMWDSESGMVDNWHKFCQKQMRDSFHPLDETLIFSNTETNKKDYASKRLTYPLEAGSISSYDKLMSTLYSPEERHKIEWAIGSVVSGESKTLQKFMVLYGAAGTGKSTILNIIQQLFEGYYSVFDAKALGSSSNQFALEAFKTNPLVAIQHDGDLSKIEDNTRLNSLVSHEVMTVNEKFKGIYSNRYKCFLFMGTNKPVKITDGKSGLIRRLIDVSPSGKKLSSKEYRIATKQVTFELGSIAQYCLGVYTDNPDAYNDYIPIAMLGASNDFYNFVIDGYHIFKNEDGTTLKAAWEMYKTYCDEAKVPYPFSQRTFKEEMKNYFWEFKERFVTTDGTRLRSYYSGFRTDQFEEAQAEPIQTKEEPSNLINFEDIESVFDATYSDCPAQYATSDEIPSKKWVKVKTTLSDIDTSKLHYTKVQEQNKQHIVIDFDIRDESGNKSFEKNREEASKWPATYAELSKSGCGVHLHYIYTGDVEQLSRIYADDIEVKVFTGDSPLRRKLTKCNNLPIATISSGLPLKGDKKVIDINSIQSEKGLRTLIKRNLNKEIHPGTASSVNFIHKILEDAYTDGLHYDVSDMKNAVLAFAASSTNQAEISIKLANQAKFKSEDTSEAIDNNEMPIVFFDVEVFPNLFLINWKVAGKDKPIVRMINPKPSAIEELLKYRLVGFNCRRYDNHMLYAGLMGYTNEQLYNLSQRIISGDRNAFFGEAYNISYTDIFDFASAGNKKSLKKLQLEMGIHHQELGLPWDQPVAEELWEKVAEYCDNDVLSTEEAFYYLVADWIARQILADLAGMTVNDTTNTLTTRIIFGTNRKPQSQFNHRNLAEPVFDIPEDVHAFLSEAAPKMMSQTHGDAGSLLPYFPGYKYENGVSTYRDEKVGEGGYVYAEPGMYVKAAVLDVVSMHPHSVILECLFGPKFTKAFKEIVDGRVSIKHKAWDEVNNMLDGKLTPYIQKVLNGEMSAKQLADALKTAINSVYGLTSAKFDNAFRDIRNKDNIVAKRGALFMIELKHEVQKRGFVVAHIKTDSIKIPNATPEIIQFVMEFGEKYGYEFEHENTYDRMCLVNDAVYIARDANQKVYCSNKKCGHEFTTHEASGVCSECGTHWTKWAATGKQFSVPYVFKTLFSGGPIEFDDMCETFEVKKGSLHLDMNEGLPDVSAEVKEHDKLMKKILKMDPNDPAGDDMCVRIEELALIIEQSHDYRFIGRVGQFTPIQDGQGGGVLYRVNEGKNYAASGSSGYRWLESEMVRELGKEECVDKHFYTSLVDGAVDAISEYGNFEWFISDEPELVIDDLPWTTACGKETCKGCKHLSVETLGEMGDIFHLDCELGHDISDLRIMNEDDDIPFL